MGTLLGVWTNLHVSAYTVPPLLFLRDGAKEDGDIPSVGGRRRKIESLNQIEDLNGRRGRWFRSTSGAHARVLHINVVKWRKVVWDRQESVS